MRVASFSRAASACVSASYVPVFPLVWQRVNVSNAPHYATLFRSRSKPWEQQSQNESRMTRCWVSCEAQLTRWLDVVGRFCTFLLTSWMPRLSTECLICASFPMRSRESCGKGLPGLGILKQLERQFRRVRRVSHKSHSKVGCLQINSQVIFRSWIRLWELRL